MTSLQLPALAFQGQYGLPLSEIDEEINVDLFAGGGGASTGLEMGLGRPVHIAINHNPAAISMHQANHPGALHLETDVWVVDPVQVLAGRRIGWFHASPDCTHHSQAAGGQPRKKEIRDLSWVVSKWAGIGKPRVISLENVKQIRSWGPLIAKRCKKTDRVMRLDGTVAKKGERVPRGEQFLVPDPKRKGRTWRRFLAQLESLGYQVEHRILRACDYGAPTSRERLFLVARCDGQPIIWPEPTHAAKPAKSQKPYRTAAECIDWSVPSQSIFTRKKPLADATLRRIAKGIQREVIGKAKPFIVPIANWSRDAVHPVDQPLNTVTAWPRGGSFAVATPVMVNAAHGEGRPGGVKRWGRGSKPADEPLGTITASGSGGHSVATAVLAGVGGRAGQTEPRAVDSPAYTITAKADAALVTAFLVQANGGFNTTHSKSLDEPMTTVTNTGSQQQLITVSLSQGDQERALRCAAFLMKYYSEGGQWQGLDQPLDTLTTRDRLALVTVANTMATNTGTLTQIHGIDGQWMTNADLRELARQLNQRAIDGQRMEAEAAHPPRHPATPSFFEYPTFDESTDMDPCMLRGRHD